MKKIICIMLIMLVGFANISLASTGTKEATLQYVGISININNNIISTKDVNGNIVNPFIIDGTTYLPIRAVSEALGKDVSWDAENYAVYINDSSESKSLENFSRRNR